MVLSFIVRQDIRISHSITEHTVRKMRS